MIVDEWQEILRSAAFLRSVLDALSANIAVLDDQGVIRIVNASWRQYADENGLAWPDHGVGRNYLATMEAARGDQADYAWSAAQGIRSVMQGHTERYAVEYPCDSPGRPRWFMMWVTPIALPRSRGVVVAHEEITARKLSEFAAEKARRAEEQQRRLAERRRAIASGLGDAIAVLNSERPLTEVLTLILDLALNLLGAQAILLRPHGGAAQAILRCASPEATPAPMMAWADTCERLASRPGTPAGVTIVDAAQLPGGPPETKGTLLAARVTVNGRDEGLLLIHYAAPRTMLQEEMELARDVASQVALAIGNARLRERAESQAVASERRRMMRELHDSVSQALFSAHLIADALPRLLGTHPEQVEQGLEELKRLTRTAHADIRALLLDLEPSAFGEQPLGTLLQRLADVMATRGDIPIREQLDTRLSLPGSVKLALYRIAEEALNNAIRHSSATQITLALEQVPNGVSLLIEDDGVGFDPALVRPGHLGLGIMRERATGIGATLQIASAPGQGTEIRVLWNAQEGNQHA